MPLINRRSLITGLVSLVAAPAIVRAGSLMPVKMLEPTPIEMGEYTRWFISPDGRYISNITYHPGTVWKPIPGIAQFLSENRQ